MEKVITSIIRRMSDVIDQEQLMMLSSIVYDELKDYVLISKKNELMPYEEVNKQYVEGFLAWKLMEGKSHKTIKSYGFMLNKSFEFIGNNVTKISNYDFFIYLSRIQKDGASKTYAENIRRALSSFYSWMHEKGFVEKNPMKGIAAIKQEKKVKKPFNDIELERIRDSCKTIREKAMIEVLYSCGVRVSELCDMTLKDVDFLTGECNVFGKGAKERIVYMNDKCMYLLKEYLNSRADESEYLFVHSRGKASGMSPGGIRNVLKDIEERCGVPNIHPHRFRRTLATNLLKKGMDLEKVAAILGHDNLKVTLGYCSLKREQVKYNYNILMSA